MAEKALSIPVDRIGDYRLLARLGAGGMGVVYKALDLKLRRTVALKFLAEGAIAPADRERLLREARAASVLDHVNIATMHAVEEAEDGRLFLVMGYYEGETLAEKIGRAALPRAPAIDIACQIMRGLEHAHAHGIIHRDVKPSNVIVTRDGTVKIVDFGLARHFSLAGSTVSANLSGTFFYMSPEQAKGKPLDGRSDIWSVGVVLYQMVTGRLPFEGETVAATLLAIINEPPKPLFAVEDELQFILYRALSKSPEARYATCAEMLQDLQRLDLRENQPPASIDPHELRRVQRAAESAASFPGRWDRVFGRRWLRAAVLVVLAALAVGGALRWRAATRQPARTASLSASAAPAETVPVAYESYLKGREYLKRYDKADNLSKAITSLERAVQDDPGLAVGYAALGEAYWDKYIVEQNPRWLQQAEVYYKRAIKLDDQLPVVHIILGRIYSGSDKQLSLQEFQRALKLQPHNADALLGLAGVYESMGRLQDAERSYQEAVALRPDDWDGAYQLGKFYFQQGHYEKAAEEWRRVVRITPDNPRAHSSLGVALQELGRFDESEAELRKSLALQPTYPAYAMLGRLYYQQKRWAEAAAMGEKAVRLNQTDYRVWALLGPAYEWLRQEDNAARAYREERARLEEAVKLNPEDAELQSDLAQLYSKLRLREKAIASIQAALARAPEDPVVLTNAGETYESLGDRTTALRLLEKALKQGSPMGELERNPGLRNLLLDPRFRRIAEAAAPPHR